VRPRIDGMDVVISCSHMPSYFKIDVFETLLLLARAELQTGIMRKEHTSFHICLRLIKHAEDLFRKADDSYALLLVPAVVLRSECCRNFINLRLGKYSEPEQCIIDLETSIQTINSVLLSIQTNFGQYHKVCIDLQFEKFKCLNAAGDHRAAADAIRSMLAIIDANLGLAGTKIDDKLICAWPPRSWLFHAAKARKKFADFLIQLPQNLQDFKKNCDEALMQYLFVIEIFENYFVKGKVSAALRSRSVEQAALLTRFMVENAIDGNTNPNKKKQLELFSKLRRLILSESECSSKALGICHFNIGTTLDDKGNSNTPIQFKAREESMKNLNRAAGLFHHALKDLREKPVIEGRPQDIAEQREIIELLIALALTELETADRKYQYKDHSANSRFYDSVRLHYQGALKCCKEAQENFSSFKLRVELKEYSLEDLKNLQEPHPWRFPGLDDSMKLWDIEEIERRALHGIELCTHKAIQASKGDSGAKHGAGGTPADRSASSLDSVLCSWTLEDLLLDKLNGDQLSDPALVCLQCKRPTLQHESKRAAGSGANGNNTPRIDGLQRMSSPVITPVIAKSEPIPEEPRLRVSRLSMSGPKPRHNHLAISIPQPIIVEECREQSQQTQFDLLESEESAQKQTILDLYS
jgi:hypothetical protein